MDKPTAAYSLASSTHKLPKYRGSGVGLSSPSGPTDRLARMDSMMSKRSNGSGMINSHSGVALVQNRYDIVRSKQDKDLDRWKRQLAI